MGSMKDLLGDTPAPAYPMHPGFTDETTSKAAAVSVSGSSAQARGEILASLRSAGPATADEMAERMGWSVLYARPRMSELAKMGLVVPLIGHAGKPMTRSNCSGRAAKVWQAMDGVVQ